MIQAPKIQVLDCSKSTNYWKNKYAVIVCWNDVTVKFFSRCRVSFGKIIYWSLFHDNILAGSGVMKIFVFKGLRQKSRNRKYLHLSNIWRLGYVRDIKFGENFSNKELFNAAKCQPYRFSHFWVSKGKPTWGIKLPLPHPD